MTHHAQEMRRGYLYAIAVVFIWAGFVISSRAAGKSPLTAYDLMALRYGVAVVCILPFWLKHRTRLFEWRKLVLCATGALGFCALAFNGFRHAPASHATILFQGFMPFLVAIIAYLLAGERPSRTRLKGLALIAVGVAVMASESFHAGDNTLLGDFLILGASISFSIYTVLLRRWNIHFMESSIAVTMLAGILYLPVYFLFLPKNIMETPLSMCIFHGFYQGIMVAVIQLIVYARAVIIIGPSRMALITSTVPVLASLGAWGLLSESITLPVAIGLAFIFAGAILGNRSGVPKNVTVPVD